MQRNYLEPEHEQALPEATRMLQLNRLRALLQKTWSVNPFLSRPLESGRRAAGADQQSRRSSRAIPERREAGFPERPARGTNIWPQAVDDLMFGIDEVDEYQVVLTSSATEADIATVRVMPQTTLSDGKADHVIDRVARVFATTDGHQLRSRDARTRLLGAKRVQGSSLD